MKNINYNLRTKEFILGEDINEELKKCYDNFNEIEEGFTNKVDKEEGKSLVADTEIAKIHSVGSDDQDLSGLLTLDQTSPQTLLNGIPLLSPDRNIVSDNQLIDKFYADTVPSGGMKSQFFTKTASDVVGMYKAQTSYPTSPTQTITVIAVDGETIIASFIEDINTAPYRVLDGARFFHLIAKASSASRTTQLKGYVYQCDINGANPVLLRTSSLSSPLSVVDAEYVMSVWGGALEIPVTTRIKFVISVVKTGSGSNPTITISVDDDTFSRLDVPSPTGQTDISGLVPYTGATADLHLGAFALAATEDLVLKTGPGKTVVYQQPTYRDEYPVALIPAGGAAAPDEVDHTIGGVQRRLRGFDGNAIEERLSGSFEISHDYMVDAYAVVGRGIEAHLHWRPSTTGTGTVIWYLDWEYSPPNAAPIPQATIQVTATIDSNKQYWHLLHSFGILLQPSTPFSLGGKIGFNLRRTPTTDTYASDALLEQCALHIPCDKNGSRQIYEA